MLEIINQNDFNKIVSLFNDIRFHMARSVLEGLMGKAFVDSISNPKVAFLVVRRYCFMSGEIEKAKLKEIIDKNFLDYILIPSDNLCKSIEEIYQNRLNKAMRYAFKKEVKFDKSKLEKLINDLPNEYSIVQIDSNMADKIKEEKFITITDDYEKNGIGYCCLKDNEIIGVASSNIIYKDGIEVSIKVDERYRRKKIASAMASTLILACLRQNKKVSWDAANEISLALAKKLGFEYDSAYRIYKF